MIRTLVIDDEKDICRFLELVLTKEGYDVTTAITGNSAAELISQQDFKLIVTDLKLPDMSGIEIVRFVKEKLPNAQIIVITGYGTIETAVEAIKGGAYDFLTKPLSLDKIRITCKHAIETIKLTEEINMLRRELHGSFENIVGKSSSIEQIFKIIKQTEESDSNVFITGESGTGKELVARAIHYNSKRCNNRFVAVNCGAISQSLIESELFGHVKGAFTGAIRDKNGFFEAASMGTLFLDEIGETMPDFQVKLLRTLQDGEFYKVGSNSPVKSNVRVIAATNRDIKKAVSEGSFREDLYYRLNVIAIHIPPLRERRDDIPLLAMHFLKKASSKYENKSVIEITTDAMNALLGYDFPGNIRELENFIEYAVAVAIGDKITINDLPPIIRKTHISQNHTEGLKPLKSAMEEYERSLLVNALAAACGNISKAARLLNIHRQRLQLKIKEHSIDINRLKDNTSSR
ncbi:MAG: sigma-54-dependent Fis family transcriptional regulator [Nitrospirae bacterium]|nr:sigma-54-dependent Fis family transcriptional regulator [Nitrospirota bacterium]MBF0535181.1 sigma-54-dependent Fis family transcriptional regulator [Nitrospirota bacterium]MBF0615200.1 sigma-54-dependent Fis family transcriptional regulator [Nitrospirota bacterium]